MHRTTWAQWVAFSATTGGICASLVAPAIASPPLGTGSPPGAASPRWSVAPAVGAWAGRTVISGATPTTVGWGVSNYGVTVVRPPAAQAAPAAKPAPAAPPVAKAGPQLVTATGPQPVAAPTLLANSGHAVLVT